jgi:hypothetical protein
VVFESAFYIEKCGVRQSILAWGLKIDWGWFLLVFKFCLVRFDRRLLLVVVVAFRGAV